METRVTTGGFSGLSPLQDTHHVVNRQMDDDLFVDIADPARPAGRHFSQGGRGRANPVGDAARGDGIVGGDISDLAFEVVQCVPRPLDGPLQTLFRSAAAMV